MKPLTKREEETFYDYGIGRITRAEACRILKYHRRDGQCDFNRLYRRLHDYLILNWFGR